MASAEDTEITLGTGKLLVLFFGLVGVCALFFALGYSLGRKSEPTVTARAAPAPQTSQQYQVGARSTGNPAQSMTFYKAVEQKDPNPQLTPPADTKTNTGAVLLTNSHQRPGPPPLPGGNPNESTTRCRVAGYFVQVAAVSKQEDAESLVDALKKKEYPAFVASQTTDKLFRVQLGPFAEMKEAEAMRTR